MDAVQTGRGGVITLPAWRDDLGLMPTQAKFSVPDLGIVRRQASILKDGTVRGRIQLSEASLANEGVHDVVWQLQMPILGIEDPDFDEPQAEDVETGSQFEVTADPLKLDPARDFKDAQGMPTPTYMRQKTLFGIPLIDKDGRLLPDVDLQSAIDAALDQVATRLDYQVVPRIFNSIPGWTPDPVAPGDPPLPRVVAEPGVDFDPDRFRNGSYAFFQLRRRPVRRLIDVALYIGDSRVADVPAKWMRLNPDMGQVQLLPDTLTTLAIGLGGIAFPTLGSSVGGSSVPHLWRVAYEVGPPDGAIRQDLFELVTWIAARSVLITVSDAAAGPVSSYSTSLDGVSESVSLINSAQAGIHGPFITEIGKRIDEWFAFNEDAYRGIRFMGT